MRTYRLLEFRSSPTSYHEQSIFHIRLVEYIHRGLYLNQKELSIVVEIKKGCCTYSFIILISARQLCEILEFKLACHGFCEQNGVLASVSQKLSTKKHG
jgi:hypothetical protein